MNDLQATSSRRLKPHTQAGRDLALEIERLRAQVARMRSRPERIDLTTLRTYEEMLESRLRLLEQNA